MFLLLFVIFWRVQTLFYMIIQLEFFKIYFDDSTMQAEIVHTSSDDIVDA